MSERTNDQAAEQLKQVNAQLSEIKQEALKKAEDALKEAKNAGEISEKTKNEVDKAMTDLNNMRDLQNELKVQLGEAEQMFARTGNGSGSPTHARAGDLVVKDEAIMAQVGIITAGQRLSVAVPRNALTSFAVNPVDGNTQIVSAPLNRLTVRDLLQPGQTSASAVAYLRETGWTNNAAPVAENTTKPYSEITYEEVLSAVRTIAHLLKVSKQTLDDLPQLRSVINGRLLNGLKRAEDTQLLFGSFLNHLCDGEPSSDS